MICILHGYLLEGSGSSLWTRAIVQALGRQGVPLLLVCQEPRPEIYDFVAAAYVHEPDGGVTTLFERDTPYPAACTLHKPRLGDTLPVYVGDIYEEFSRIVPMVELPDREIEAYLDPKRPDGDAAEKLSAVDWATETPLLFIGRLIASKGPQNILAALPRILEGHPNTKEQR